MERCFSEGLVKAGLINYARNFVTKRKIGV
jgi:hypothetical protein